MQQPYAGKAKIEEHTESILIRIPVTKNWIMLIFLPIWLCGWAFGLFMASRMFLSGTTEKFNSSSSFSMVFLAVWLIGWTVGGGYAIYTWLRMVFGIEILEFKNDMISIKQQLLTFKQNRDYNPEHIWRLRTIPIPAPSIFDNRQYWGQATQSLAFDYGARTIRFGNGIDEAEATQILEMVRQKFPQYHPRESTAWKGLAGHRP